MGKLKETKNFCLLPREWQERDFLTTNLREVNANQAKVSAAKRVLRNTRIYKCSRNNSSAARVAISRTASRERFLISSFCANVPAGVLTAIKTVPAGTPSWSSGPATPVVPIPQVVPQSFATCSAMARATGSEKTLNCSINSAGTPRIFVLSAVS